MQCKTFDLVKMNLLPENWQHEIIDIATQFSELLVLNGQYATSLEVTSEDIDVFMVYGNIIHEKLPWLYNLYTMEILRLANTSFNDEYEYSVSIPTSITLNSLRGKHARYELHVDSNPLTGLLFVTTHLSGTGGELVFYDGEEILTIYPKSGELLLFDAREVPHTVLPLNEDSTRISIPMNYYFKGQQQQDWNTNFSKNG